MKGKTLFAAVAAPVLAGIVAGCGSSTTNNDQGVTFLALGYFADSAGTTGVSGVNAVLSSDIGASGIQGIPGAVGQQTLVFMGVENRLRNQFIRLTKFDCEYLVPGSSLSIPPDSFAAAGVVTPNPGIGGPSIDGAGASGNVGFGAGGGGAGAAGGTAGQAGGATAGATGGGAGGGGTVGTSGPATGQGGRLFSQFPVIGPDIYSYLNNNREALPELPFRMQALCRATGVSSAGDAFATNEAGITVTFFEVAEFPNPDGGTGSTGTGGDVDGFDGGDTGDDGTTTTVGSSTGSSAESL